MGITIKYRDEKCKGRILTVSGLKGGNDHNTHDPRSAGTMDIEIRYVQKSNCNSAVALDGQVIPEILAKFSADPHPLRKHRRFNKDTPIVSIIADGLDACVDGRGYDHIHHKATVLANLSPRLLKSLREIMKAIDDDYGRVHFSTKQWRSIANARTLLGLLADQ